MNPTTPQEELRPSCTVMLPRVHYPREPIAPQDCRLGPRCLVCSWRREGLIPPASPRAEARTS